MNKVDIKTKSKLKVTYIDLMADTESEEMTVPLDELFVTALSMNNMGFYEGYETEYIVDKMVMSNPSIIDVISDEYKLELVEVWDYEVIDVLNENNESVKDNFTKEFSKAYLRVDGENQFEIFKVLSQKLANKDRSLFEILTIALMGIANHNEVYSVFKTDIQNLINDCIKEI